MDEYDRRRIFSNLYVFKESLWNRYEPEKRDYDRKAGKLYPHRWLENEHFDYLRQVVLPYLKQKEAKKQDLCIWSGASSTGEEPYMLAMLLMDFFGLEHARWDTKVLATDISTDVLRQAVAGVYSREQIESLPEHWKRRFLHASSDGSISF